MQTFRRYLRILACLVCLSFALPLATLAQTTAAASLPPEAEEAIKKGILAAKQQDYLLAIRFFQDARKIAPQAPEIYYDLGLAESKIPGRELRAIAWFGAYLVGNPNAQNAAAVKEQIDVLDVKSQSNNTRLVNSVQEAASTLSINYRTSGLIDVARLWMEVGDFTAAMNTVDLQPTADWKIGTLVNIADTQVKAGDIASAKETLKLALNTINLIQDAIDRIDPLMRIANTQMKAGDTAGAHETLAYGLQTANYDVHDTFLKCNALSAMARAQGEARDYSGAQKTITSALETVNLIHGADAKNMQLSMIANDQRRIADSQLKSGDVIGAKKTLVSARIIAVSNINGEQKDQDLSGIAESQIKAGDVAGARITAELSTDRYGPYKSVVMREIAIAETSDAGRLTKTSDTTQVEVSNSFQSVIHVITVSDWISKLEDVNQSNDGSLNTDPFLNLAGYLKSLPTSDSPQTVFESLRDTATKLARAQNVINKMLAQQAKK